MKKYILLLLVLCATQGHAFDIGIQPQEEGFEAQERDEPQNFSEEIQVQAIERKIANAMGPILEMRRAQEVEEHRKIVEEARKRMDEFRKNQEEARKIQEEALKIKEEALKEDRKRIDERIDEIRKKEEEDRLKAAAEAEKARLDAEESDASGSVD